MNLDELREAYELAAQLEDIDDALAKEPGDCGDLPITFREGFTNSFKVTMPGEDVQEMLSSRRMKIEERLKQLGVDTIKP